MASVCVSRNLGIDGGVLSIEPWTLPRHVHDVTYNSVGDGAFTQLTTLPGKLMIDTGIITWTSDSPLPCRVLIRLQRATRDLLVSNPNYAQIRDRYTVAIGGANPRTPDVSATYQGATGASMDLSATAAGSPYPGRYWVYEDASIIEDWSPLIQPGEELKMWYRCNLWTPPPWSNNANNGVPDHSATVRHTRIQLIAFPEQDTTVVA